MQEAPQGRAEPGVAALQPQRVQLPEQRLVRARELRQRCQPLQPVVVLGGGLPARAPLPFAAAPPGDVGLRARVLAVVDQQPRHVDDRAGAGRDESQPPVVKAAAAQRQRVAQQFTAEQHGVAGDAVPEGEGQRIAALCHAEAVRKTQAQRRAALVDQRRVGIGQRVPVDGGVQRLQLVGMPDVVLIAGRDVVAHAHRHRSLEGGCTAQVALVAQDAQPRILAGRLLQHLPTAVGGRVVDGDDLQRAPRLRAQRGQLLGQVPLAVEGGQRHRDQRRRRRRDDLPVHSRQCSAIHGAGLAKRQLPRLWPASASGGFITPWKIRMRAPVGMLGARQKFVGKRGMQWYFQLAHQSRGQ
jgi:hypothetical protein